MKKAENRRNLGLILVFLLVVLACSIANIVKLNVFALILNMIMVIFLCFVLGYSYCCFEKENNEIVEEKAPIDEPKTLSDVLNEFQKGMDNENKG